MYGRIIINDLKGSKLISVTTCLFIAASAMLLALAGMLFVNLAGAIDGLMTVAKTPHFMQMHSGDVDFERLQAFSEANTAIEAFQVMEFVNFKSWDMTVQGQPFDGGIQDNGFIKQGKQMDFLVDMDGEIIAPKNGEIYVPLGYMRDGSINKGDSIALYGREFTVAGFLRDSQMNSPLSSSKRFLISNSDFAAIHSMGEMEYLIEFRLHDLDDLRAFETAYVAAGLESNGPTLTYPLFRLINGLSDGLMIAVILLVSFFVVVITFLCIRFTLLARIEDDYREIGVLKAVGLHNSDIIRLYLARYAVVSFAGCVCGYAASLLVKDSLLEDIRLFMGRYHQTGAEMFLGMISALLIFGVVLAYVYAVLGRIQGISVTESIRLGAVQEQSKMYRRFLMSKSRVLDSNVYLAIKDVVGRKKLYWTMMLILLISMFIMTLPLNLYSTISSDRFVSHMGVGKSDFRIDIQQTTDIQEKVNEVAAAMENDSDIKRFVVLTARSYVVLGEDGGDGRLLVETGDHSVFPVIYSHGRMPTEPDHIALSAMNAEELDKGVDDTITILVGKEQVELTVSGVYSDVTNGGKTAKAAFSDSDETVMWSVISAEAQEGANLGPILSRYSNEFSYAKVSDVEEYVQLVFGSTIAALRRASSVAIGVALFVSFLITLLFVKMLVSKDRYSIAIMKSIGHSSKDICFQFMVRVLLVAIASIGLGMSVSITLGERLAGLMISSFGATSFSFEINWIFTYLVWPSLMLIAIYTATVIGSQGVKNTSIVTSIKE